MGLLDGAAACVAAYAYEAACVPDTKEKICMTICCCEKFPIIKRNRLKQLCVDRLMAANNLSEDGILSGVPYDMTTLEVANGYPKATIAAQLKKFLEGAYFKNRIRIPDVTVLKDPNGPITQDNIEKIYEIKFPGDTERDGQMNDYGKIAGDPDKVKKIDVAKGDCNCDGRNDPDKIPVPEKVKQAAIDRVNDNIYSYIDTYGETLAAAMREAQMGVDVQSLFMAYQRATDPHFFLNTLLQALRLPKIGAFGKLGRFPKPLPLPAPAIP